MVWIKTEPERDLEKSLYPVGSPLPHLSNGGNSHFSALLTGSLRLLNKTVDVKALRTAESTDGKNSVHMSSSALTSHDSHPFFLLLKNCLFFSNDTEKGSNLILTLLPVVGIVGYLPNIHPTCQSFLPLTESRLCSRANFFSRRWWISLRQS